MNLPKELTARIADHLSKVRKNLSGLPPDEQKEILQSIESHIYDALQSKGGEDPSAALLEAVLAEMDPPESYGELPVVPKKDRRWQTAAPLLALVALVVIAYPALNHIKRPATPQGSRPEGPPVPEQPTGTLITEGVGWKDYVIGKTRAELIQALGTPQTNTPEWMLRWDKYPYIDVAMSEANTCREVRFNRGFTGQTAAGIKIGSSFQEMRDAYGNAERTWARTTGPCVIAEWPGKGMHIYTYEGRVSQIIICEPKPKNALPFIDDPAVHGRWVSIDLVDSIEAFNPRKQTSEGTPSLKELTFSPEGKTSHAWTWTKGRLIAEDSLSSYTIKEIGGEDYLFTEWMSGDVIEKGLPPKYCVLKRDSAENRLMPNSNHPEVFLKPVKQPSTPQPPPGKYAFQIITVGAPAEIIQSPQVDVEKVIQHPNIKICEYPTLIAGLGESITNDQTKAVSMDVDYGLIDGKPVTKEKIFKLGDSISITVNRIENGAVSYHLNVCHLELAGFFEHKIKNGFLEKTQPRFKKEAVDTDLTQKLNSWILINGIIEQRSDGGKINQITCVRVIPPVTAKEVHSETRADDSPAEITDTQKGSTMKQSPILAAASIVVATNLITGGVQTGFAATNNTASGGTPAVPQVEVRKASDGVIAKQKELARRRMRKDSKIYSQEELQEIESLYQVANKKWRSEEGKESLKELISKYKSANRTGCALLYLGQMSTGDEQIEYLQQAISEFSDCFYGDGAQVGAYARFVLLYRYRNSGEMEKAAKLAEEIRTDYPDAIDHRGRNIVELLETAEN